MEEEKVEQQTDLEESVEQEEPVEESTDDENEEDYSEDYAEEPEETEDAEESDDDDGLDESEYLAQFDLPGNPKTLEDALKSYKELLNERSVQKQRDSEEAKTERVLGDEKKDQKAEPLFGKNLVSSQIDQLVQSGRLKGEAEQTWRELGSTVDKALDPVIEKQEQAFNAVATAIGRIYDSFRDQSWRRFKYSHLVKREQLDPLMKQNGYLDYDQAFRLAALNNPAFMKQIVKDAEKRGEKKLTKKLNKPKFRTSANRGKPRTEVRKIDPKQYMNPDGTLDRGRLAQLPEEEADRVIAAYARLG